MITECFVRVFSEKIEFYNLNITVKIMMSQTGCQVLVSRGVRTSPGIQCTFLQRKSLYLSTKIYMKTSTKNSSFCIYLIKTNVDWLLALTFWALVYIC